MIQAEFLKCVPGVPADGHEALRLEDVEQSKQQILAGTALGPGVTTIRQGVAWLERMQGKDVPEEDGLIDPGQHLPDHGRGLLRDRRALCCAAQSETAVGLGESGEALLVGQRQPGTAPAAVTEVPGYPHGINVQVKCRVDQGVQVGAASQVRVGPVVHGASLAVRIEDAVETDMAQGLDERARSHSFIKADATGPDFSCPSTIHQPSPIRMDTNTPASTFRPIPFVFEGRAEDYFAIWIVNLLFTVLTLGVYSAWAKVRRLQFFYGNTRLEGDGFSYLARPVVLLRARILVLAVLLLYFTAFWVSPPVGFFLTLGFVPIYPWIIHRSLRFSSRMTAWRSVRFDWHGTYPQAFKVFVLWPVASVLTLGIAFPLAARAVREYLANSQAFGHARFSVRTGAVEYYLAAGVTLLVFLFGGSVIAAVLGVVLALLGFGWESDAFVIGGAELIALLAAPLAAYAGGELFMVLTRNIVVNRLVLHPGHRFDCNLSGATIIWISITNALAILLSLGLLWPWAQVRRWRYLANAMTVRPSDSLERFIDSQHAAGVAVASEYADFEGYEVGL